MGFESNEFFKLKKLCDSKNTFVIELKVNEAQTNRLFIAPVFKTPQSASNDRF
jgi:hypothetical protein